MIVLDSITLAIVSALLNCAMALLLLHAWSRSKTYPGFGLWVAGSVCWALGSVISVVRPEFLPISVIILVGNTLNMMHVMLYYEGFRRYYQLPHSWWGTPLNIGLLTVEFLFRAYFYFVDDSFALRAALNSCMLAIFFIRVMLEPLLFSRYRPRVLPIQVVWSASVLPVAFLLIVRFLWYMTDGFVDNVNLAMDPVLPYLLLFGLVAQFGQIYTFLSLTNARIVEDLMSSEDVFKRLTESAPNVIWQIDLNRNITYSNPACKKILGYEHEDVLHCCVTDFVGKAVQDGFFSRLENYFEQKENIIKGGPFNDEYPLVRKDGALLWCEAKVNALKDQRGIVRGYIFILWDISQRKQEEARLNVQLEEELRLRQEQENFLDMISHEYRTPLAIIQSSIDIFRRKAAVQDSGLKNNLDRIQRATERLLDVFETTHRCKGAQSRLLHPVLVEIDASAFFSKTYKAAVDLWGERFTVDNHLPPACSLHADEYLLRTIVLNLLENAVKYSPPSLLVALGLRCCDSLLEITIVNTANGPLTDDIRELFKKYHRGRNSFGTSGAGIGLHLVEDGVRRCGGNVELFSDAESRVTAKVTFPLFTCGQDET
ncbi:PAS domain-containing sensor histidine kinase [uncultured Desulfuromonas sp.]|uniref:PAS domain-containing sensor histidine kinase n=1 Tax=uncultured Desulfuromonas sp. TaxID=181013 RepID=UPI002AAB7039|nr:PAS domain-containing sensor histidine kinase [uncultured Desulfuromonas sp.]